MSVFRFSVRIYTSGTRILLTSTELYGSLRNKSQRRYNTRPVCIACSVPYKMMHYIIWRRLESTLEKLFLFDFDRNEILPTQSAAGVQGEETNFTEFTGKSTTRFDYVILQTYRGRFASGKNDFIISKRWKNSGSCSLRGLNALERR